MPTFGEAERNIATLLSTGNRFTYGGEIYTIEKCGKPTCSSGEPKTDVYILAKASDSGSLELKISFKKENADFLENKTNADRAEQLFGRNWSQIIINSTESISQNFEQRPLVYKNSFRRTEAGAITLGWKFELLNKSGGDLSEELAVTKEQLIDIYSGSNLDSSKRDAMVNGVTIRNSGVANCVSAQYIVESQKKTTDPSGGIFTAVWVSCFF